MMKKMLALVLVLGVASVASAGIVVVSPDVATANVETSPINVAVVQQAIFVGVTGAGSISSTSMDYIGNLASITDFTGADPDLTNAVDFWIGEYAAANAGFAGGASSTILFVEFFDGTAPPGTPPPVMGQLASLGIDGAVEVYLLDASLEQGVFSAVSIPEPITFALLGLGGLFLRRRK